MRSKACSSCKEVKLISEFNRRGGKERSRYRSQCKDCCYLYETHLKARKKQHYKNKSAKENQLSKERRAKYYRDNKLKFRVAKYNITESDYYKMYNQQKGSCIICYLKFDNSSRLKTPHIDHCHITGKVRGLLCLHCNSALGQLKENEKTILNLLNYIRKAKSEQL